MIAPTRILVTGGAGFVGSHFVRRCVDDGHEIHLALRPSTSIERLAGLGDRLTLHRLSLSDSVAVRACLAQARPTHIFHLIGDTASRHDAAVEQARRSVGGVADLLCLVEAAAQAETPPTCFLRTGSIAEYGAAPLPFREDQREQPGTGYAAGIVAGTHYAMAIAPHLPFPLITARLALVYGSGQAADFLVPSLIASCVEGRPILLDRPHDRRDLIHVADVVQALLRLAAAPPSGPPIFNVGSGETVSVAALAQQIVQMADANPMLVRQTVRDDSVALRLSIRRITAATGWAPRIALADGLAALVADARRGLAAAAA